MYFFKKQNYNLLHETSLVFYFIQKQLRLKIVYS